MEIKSLSQARRIAIQTGQEMPKDLLELDKFKLIIELFNPNADNDREERLIKERENIRDEKLMIIERRK